MKMYKYFKTAAVTLFTSLLVAMSSCGSRTERAEQGETIEMRHARNITMTMYDDSVTMVTLVNPWDTTATLARYALVERGYSKKNTISPGVTVLEVPLRSTVIYSGVHASLVKELGEMQTIKGVCDAEYIYDKDIKAGVGDGSIADCGSSSSPVMERIMTLKPDAILISPFENSNETARFAGIGTNVVHTAEYMEPTPLGRAEWMRFYGRLFGKGAQADSLFEEVERNYERIKRKSASSATKPSVLFERPYGGIWDVPTSGSVTGIMIKDAGGSNPFDRYTQSGSAHLSPEEVLHTAANVDIWFIRHTDSGLSLNSIKQDNALFGKIKAFRTNNVYGANTLMVPLFEDGAFHPDKVLMEMSHIIHPESWPDEDTLKYYVKIK